MLHELINTFIGDKQWMVEPGRPSDIDWRGAINLLEQAMKELSSSDKADLARHILEGDQKRRTYDYTQIEDRICLKFDTIKDQLQHLTSEQLESLYTYINGATGLIDLFRRRNRPTEPPESPTIPNRPAPTRRTAPHGQPEPFDGTQENPMPLKQPVGDVALTNWVDGLTFCQLCSVADRYDVPHNETQWHDGDWPDKEDELRVAVAEAMGKMGQ